MNISLLGPTGAGKSTMAAALTMIGHLSPIETGAFVRRNFPQDKLKGGLADCEKQIREYVDQELSRTIKGAAGHVLDGFPRTLDQLKWLLESGHKMDFLFLDVDEVEARRRVALRVRSDVYRFEEHYKGQAEHVQVMHEFMQHHKVGHYHAVGYNSPEELARWLLQRVAYPHELGKEGTR